MSSSGPGAQSDVRQRTVLPQMLHGRPLSSAAVADEVLCSDEYLDKIEDELNKRVDDQVDVLRDGMADLVKLTDVSLSSRTAAPALSPNRLRTPTLIRLGTCRRSR